MFKPFAHADAALSASPERMRVEGDDPRADNRGRVIDVAREAVTIHRTAARVAMTIRVPATAYRGVALRLSGLTGGGACEAHYRRGRAVRPPRKAARHSGEVEPERAGLPSIVSGHRSLAPSTPAQGEYDC